MYAGEDGVDGQSMKRKGNSYSMKSGGRTKLQKLKEEEKSDKFVPWRKKKTCGPTSEQRAIYVEKFLAKFDVAAEIDADLNRDLKPALEKLKMLPTLVSVLKKQQYQKDFLARGVLSTLKNWLEPLPDGSFPNMNVRTAVLEILAELPVDLKSFDRREQLKKSGLGRMLMFFSKLEEESAVNKRYARDLVAKWSQYLFEKSTRYEDLCKVDDRMMPCTSTKGWGPGPGNEEDRRGRHDHCNAEIFRDFGELQAGRLAAGYDLRASRSQALPFDFVVRPRSKITPADCQIREEKRKREEQSRRFKLNKKVQQLKNSNRNSKPDRKYLPAMQPSLKGRALL